MLSLPRKAAQNKTSSNYPILKKIKLKAAVNAYFHGQIIHFFWRKVLKVSQITRPQNKGKDNQLCETTKY